MPVAVFNVQVCLYTVYIFLHKPIYWRTVNKTPPVPILPNIDIHMQTFQVSLMGEEEGGGK